MSEKAILAIPASQEANTHTVYWNDTEATVQTAFDNLASNGGVLSINGETIKVRHAILYHNAELNAAGTVFYGGIKQTPEFGNVDGTTSPDAPSDTIVYTYESLPGAADVDAVLDDVTDTGAARDIYPVPDAAHALATIPAPIVAPTLTAVVGGSSLAAGSYILGYSYVQGDTGQTLLSPLSTVTIALNGSISVGELTLPPNVTAVNWFMSEAVNNGTLSMHQQKSTGAAFTITTLPVDFDFADPDVCRNLTATSGGTATDVKAISVIVWGTDYEDQPISETLPAFTVNTAETQVGSKAFKRVTRVQIPAHDGTGATTSVGYGDKLGLHHRLKTNSVFASYLNNTKEGTAATVAVSEVNICSNTADLNSALDGNPVMIIYIVPALTFTS